MSSYATSSSVVGSTRFWRIRAPVLPDSWWKRTVFGDVALYSLTGTFTSPKLIAPDQIARAISGLYSEHLHCSSFDRSLAGNSSVAGEPRHHRRWQRFSRHDRLWLRAPRGGWVNVTL